MTETKPKPKPEKKPQPRDKDKLGRAARNMKRLGAMTVRDQFRAVGCDPAQGIIRRRQELEEAIAKVSAYLYDDGPLPEFLLKEEGKPAAFVLLHDLREALFIVDKEVMPYAYPKLKAAEITGPDGGPVRFERVERVIVDPNATDTDA